MYVGVIVAAESRWHGQIFSSVHGAVQNKYIRVRQVKIYVSNLVSNTAARPYSVRARYAGSAVFSAVYGAFVIGRADSDCEIFYFFGIVVEAERDARRVLPIFRYGDSAGA